MSELWEPPLGTPAAPNGAQLSLQQWLALPEDEPGELVEGRLQEEEMPDAIHELAVVWLATLLRTWLGDAGFVLGSELKLVVSESRGRKADVCVFLPSNRPPPRRGPVDHAPDIVVEVVTPSPRDERRDRVEKMEDYATLGVRNYWLVDPALRSFEAFELGADGRYIRALGATGGPVEPPGCEGLVVELDALWAELDRLGPESP